MCTIQYAGTGSRFFIDLHKIPDYPRTWRRQDYRQIDGGQRSVIRSRHLLMGVKINSQINLFSEKLSHAVPPSSDPTNRAA